MKHKEPKKINEDTDLSDTHYKGDESVHDFAKIEPQETMDEKPDDISDQWEDGEDDNFFDFEEGDVVEIDTSVGGGIGEIVEVSSAGTHAIVELINDEESGDLEKGDRVSVHLSDVIKLTDEDLDELEHADLGFGDDDLPFESASNFDKLLGDAYKGLSDV